MVLSAKDYFQHFKYLQTKQVHDLFADCIHVGSGYIYSDKFSALSENKHNKNLGYELF